MATKMVECRALIAEKLGDIQLGANPAFAEIREYPGGDFKKFPTAVILPTGGSQGTVIDTHRNRRTFTFMVTCWQEQNEVGLDKGQANDKLSAIVDAVLVAFDQDKNLNFEVERVEVVKMDFNFLANKGTYDFATFEIACTVIVPNYPVA